jgi:hypothetical protein
MEVVFEFVITRPINLKPQLNGCSGVKGQTLFSFPLDLAPIPKGVDQEVVEQQQGEPVPDGILVLDSQDN